MNEVHSILNRELCREIDAIIQRLKESCGMIADVHPDLPLRPSRERSLAVTKLQEAVMWIGKDLESISNEINPTEAEVERVAESIFYDMQENPAETRYTWVPGGNSLKQDEARKQARNKLAHSNL